MSIQGWFPLGLTGLISLLSKGLWRVFSNTTTRKHQLFGTQPSLWFNCDIHTCYWKNHSFDSTDLWLEVGAAREMVAEHLVKGTEGSFGTWVSPPWRAGTTFPSFLRSFKLFWVPQRVFSQHLLAKQIDFWVLYSGGCLDKHWTWGNIYFCLISSVLYLSLFLPLNMAYQELHTLGDGRDMNEKVNVSVHLRIMAAHGKRVCVSSCK